VNADSMGGITLRLFPLRAGGQTTPATILLLLNKCLRRTRALHGIWCVLLFAGRARRTGAWLHVLRLQHRSTRTQRCASPSPALRGAGFAGARLRTALRYALPLPCGNSHSLRRRGGGGMDAGGDRVSVTP